MAINRIFLSYMAVAGVGIGVILVIAPEARNFRVPPYFWILALMIAFELTAYIYGRGTPGTVIRMDVRLFGFDGDRINGCNSDFCRFSGKAFLRRAQLKTASARHSRALKLPSNPLT